jgi:hypothetical protein
MWRLAVRSESNTMSRVDERPRPLVTALSEVAAIAAHEILPPRYPVNVGGKWGDFGTYVLPIAGFAHRDRAA